MKKTLVLSFLIFIFSLSSLHSQRKLGAGAKREQTTRIGLDGKIDTLNTKGSTKVILSGKTKWTDYKVISHDRDTTYIDTTLTLQKEYTFNYLRTDNFELLPFHNQGQTFNNLGYSYNNILRLPDLGFRAKQVSYFEVDDVNYFEVPTTTTEIMYRTGLQQGQVVDALFTLNFSKRLNVSLSYKGLRSLGAYRNALVSNGNFRGTFTYASKNSQYRIRGHFATQDFFHQENGGLTPTSLENFMNEDPNYEQRSRLDVNLNDAYSQFDASRIYIEHSYKLLADKDTLTEKDFSNLKVGHVLTNENKSYGFNQATATTSIFGDTNGIVATDNNARSKLTNNEFNLEFNSKYVLGQLKAKVHLTDYSYGYDTILNRTNIINNYQLKTTAVSFGANWNAKIKNFNLNADATITPGSGILSGNYIKGTAVYEKDSLFTIRGSVLLSSKSPNFNMLLHQSNYDNYNWQNQFSNVNTRDLGFSVASKWLNGALHFTNIDNYTYFNIQSRPSQFEDQIAYLKVKINKEFKFWKFALDNTLMYQNVSSGSSVFRVPEFVTRNTFYYADNWFKGDAMFVNIGVTFKYFTAYNANAYNPLLAEFRLQDEETIGFPTFDVFFNARVRRTRLYLKVDNVTSGFTKKNYFSAPNYPYRDFTVRFGLVWNWFI